MRCDVNGANCVDIVGATSSTYLISAADVGSRLKVEVTATEHTASGDADLGLNTNNFFPSYSNGASKATQLGPKLMRTNKNFDYAAFTNWCTANGAAPMYCAVNETQSFIMSKVQSMPLIRTWELDNEPYFPSSTLNVASWATRMRNTAAAIKAFDSSLKVLVPLLVQANNGDYFSPFGPNANTWYPWVDHVLDAASDITDFIDGWAIHPYPDPASGPPTFTVVDTVKSQLQARSAFLPFHVTEFGWSVGTSTANNQEQTTEANQSTYLNSFVNTARGRGDIETMYYYCLHSWGTTFFESFGLFNPNGTARTAAATFAGLV